MVLRVVFYINYVIRFSSQSFEGERAGCHYSNLTREEKGLLWLNGLAKALSNRRQNQDWVLSLLTSRGLLSV